MHYQSSFKTLSIFIVFTILFASGFLSAQYAPDKESFEIQPDETIRSTIKANSRVNIETGYPVALYNVDYQTTGNTPEEMASNYLIANASQFGLSYPDLSDLSHHHTRTTNMGHVVRFRQQYQGLPVNKSELTITIDLKNKVTFVMNSYQPTVSVKDVQPKFPVSTALSMAKDHINIGGSIKYERSELMIYSNRGQSRLAYKVILGADQPIGDWHVYVDAITQELFKAVDEACYCGKHDHKNQGHSCAKGGNLNNPVDGTGNVFDPDPLSSAQVAYGTGGYTDNNDLDSPDLNGELVSVTLRDIDFTNGLYTLKGPYAEVVDIGSPFTGLFTQPTNSFNYHRGDDQFEAVNTYFHIDSNMRYMNLTLNEPVDPYQYPGGVQFDPQGVNLADNSFYSTSSGHLEFGEGCVDDAEDSDVIHHELGHGIHDWITAGNLSQVDGLSEGSGDYWAQSYNRGYNGWASTDPAYQWVFNWDGHNVCWPGRVTDYAAVYPGGLVGQIHTDGQIWSTCMMKVWDAIGQQQTDKIFLSGLSMTNSVAGQNDAANAVYTAAQNLNYPMADILQIYNLLTGCGYTLSLPPNAPPIAEFSADLSVVCTDNGGTVNFTDNSQGIPTSWDWSFPGATPSSSTMQNPTVVYTTDGVYPVTLIATNANGADTSIVMNYITVVSGNNCPTCTSTAATDVPIVIPTTGTPTITSTINFAGSGVVSDINVTNINGTHTWISDLTITLTSPTGTVVSLMDRPCGSDDDFDLGYDDDAATGTLPCPPVGGAMYIPAGPLAAFNGESAQGNWVLTIVDNADQDGGSLNGWTLEVCSVPNFAPPVADFMSDETVVCGDNGGATINFTDNSQGIPTSWNWSFPGATPSSSTMQNPSVVYSTAGVYPVTLIATNANGSDTSSVTGYITVLSGNNCPSCVPTPATDVPIVISPTGTPTITSTVNFTGSGVISDLNIPNINGVHSYVGDLTITLTSPTGTSVILMDQSCGNQADFDLGFDDDATTGTLPCPPIGGGMYIPVATLTAFNGENPQGNWVLTVDDNADQDGGSLDGWILEVCYISNANCNLSLATTFTAATCGSGGTATVTTSGGTAPFTYQWDAAANNQTAATATGLAPGTYTVVVTDNMGCQETETVTVSGTSAVATTTSSSAENCGLQDGSATVVATGGDGNYTYLWDAAAGNQTMATANNLGAGTYTVVVTDGAGCTTSASVSVGTIAGPQTTVTSTNVSCNGGNDGTSTVSANGGTPPYVFVWSNGWNLPTATGLTAGTYSGTVTDNIGCTTVFGVTITEPAAITATMASTDENGNNGDGTATATPVGGTPPYTYLWDDPTSQTTQTAINLSAAIYTVTITDSNGCVLVETVEVEMNTAVTDIEHLETFELYPNPTDGQFTILVEFEQSEKASLNIYNVLGQALFSKEINGKSIVTPIEMKSAAAGVYFAQLSTDKGSAVVRFVKN